MTVKTIKTIGICMLLFFSMLFINSGDVKAANQCSSKEKYSEAANCSYYGGISKLTFAKTESNNYCVVITYFQYEYSSILTNISVPDEEIRGKVTYDISDETVKNTLKNKTCPRLKMVNEYFTWDAPSDWGKTKTITMSDHVGWWETAGCAVSGTISFGSECSLSDGSDYKIVSSQDVGNAAKEKEDATDEPTSFLDIIRWGNKTDEYENKYAGSDACLVISSDIKEFLDAFFKILSVVGIILLVIMTAADFIKSITGSDEDGIKKAFKHTVIRIVCIIILLLLPMLVSWIINIINTNLSDGYKIGADGEPLCEIGK